MIYRLDMDGETRRLISHLTPPRKQKVKESLRDIAKHPDAGKALQKELSGFRSYRVGTFRIIYAVNRAKRMIHIIALGPRKTIYDALEKDLLKQS